MAIITTKKAKGHISQETAVLGATSDLPCLYSNNSIENREDKTLLGIDVDKKTNVFTLKYVDLSTGEITTSTEKGSNKLSTSQKKSSIALAWNIEYMANKYGLENLGFLTLTFPTNITLMSEAQKRFNSLNSNFLNSHYIAHVAVKERHKSGRIHFHLVVVLDDDIRTGFDFEAVAKKDYKSANKRLKKEWTILRMTVKKYGFGRTELLPIKSTAEGISRYVGKYISKNIQERPDEDKGTRLVNYSGDSRTANTRISLVNQGSSNWRHKCKLFAENQSDYYGFEINSENISSVLGMRWAYRYRDSILCLPNKDDEIANICYQEKREKMGNIRHKSTRQRHKRPVHSTADYDSADDDARRKGNTTNTPPTFHNQQLRC